MEVVRLSKLYDLKITNKHGGFRFPHYYHTFFNALYFLGFSPVRVSFSKISHDVQFHKNHPQKIVSILLLSLTFFFSIPAFQGALHYKLKENPASIFRITNIIIWTSNIVILTYKSWFQQEEIKSLVKVSRVPLTFLIRTKQVSYMFVVAFYLTASSYLFSSLLDLSITDVMVLGAKPMIIGLLPFPQPSNWTWTSFSFEMKSLIVVTYFFRLYKNLGGYLTQGAVLISCFAAFEISSELWGKAKNCGLPGDALELLKLYTSSKQIFAKINSATGIFLLIVFAAAISYTSERIVRILDDGSWLDAILIVSYLGTSLVAFCLAAEAHVKMKKTEEFLRQFQIQVVSQPGGICNFCKCQPASLYIENCPGQNGLVAGDFFTLTYSLLAQSGSLLLTYIIIMIQFESSQQ